MVTKNRKAKSHTAGQTRVAGESREKSLFRHLMNAQSVGMGMVHAMQQGALP